MTLAINGAVDLPKKRNGMLPVLVALFLISYGLLSTLVVEQGRTIETQRGLIRDLFNDSAQLSAMKMRETLRDRSMGSSARGRAQVLAPPSQSSPRSGVSNKNAGKAKRQTVQRPPKPADDAADSRRIPLTV